MEHIAGNHHGNHCYRRSTKLNRVVALAVSVTALTATGLLGAGARADPPRRGARPSPQSALAASTISLNESGHLHLTSKQGFTLNEEGPAAGTFSGTIHVRLTIVSTDRVKAEVSIYRSEGSISGTATASYHREGASAGFSGSLSIDRGTARYSHAHGSGLSFNGTIQNSNDAIAVHLSGPVTA